MEFYNLIGNIALGSRLRRLSQEITYDAKNIYSLYGVGLEPHWFPVFFMLMKKTESTINELAKDTGLAQSAISKIVKEMKNAHLTISVKDKNDSRISCVTLTKKGKNEAKKLMIQMEDVSTVINNFFLESGVDLWANLDAVEKTLERKNIYQRVKSIADLREKSQVKIMSFNSSHLQDFKKLNLDWIKDYWKPETEDLEILNNPQGKIIDNGGLIFIATIKDEVVGTCGLLKISNKVYELVKMTVKKPFRRKGIGYLLATKTISKAKKLGAETIFVESNSVLTPAISLYEKLKFKYIPLKSSNYSRCNVQMQLNPVDS